MSRRAAADGRTRTGEPSLLTKDARNPRNSKRTDRSKSSPNEPKEIRVDRPKHSKPPQKTFSLRELFESRNTSTNRFVQIGVIGATNLRSSCRFSIQQTALSRRHFACSDRKKLEPIKLFVMLS
mmetsp:Transcript_3014/g.8209  ORF Transcript_3014/g.8209 Transcript_3014/m.8209 type:complete len:124 (-) Transcript_3014:1555-1926(-)